MQNKNIWNVIPNTQHIINKNKLLYNECMDKMQSPEQAKKRTKFLNHTGFSFAAN